VAGAVLLPGAIANLLERIHGAAADLAAGGSRDARAPAIWARCSPRSGTPLSGAALKLASAFDFFSLWAAVMMAFGVAAAGDVPTRRALIGTLCGWVCLRLGAQTAMGGGT